VRLPNPLVTEFGDPLRPFGVQVETGVFGADMRVDLTDDGPITVLPDVGAD
jgi:D-tyrosyl-tRNA(Tyr) deacylase